MFGRGCWNLEGLGAQSVDTHDRAARIDFQCEKGCVFHIAQNEVTSEDVWGLMGFGPWQCLGPHPLLTDEVKEADITLVKVVNLY